MIIDPTVTTPICVSLNNSTKDIHVHFTCCWLLPKTKSVFTTLGMPQKCLTLLVFLLIFSSFFPL